MVSCYVGYLDTLKLFLFLEDEFLMTTGVSILYFLFFQLLSLPLHCDHNNGQIKGSVTWAIALLKYTSATSPVYNGPSTNSPLFVCAQKWTILVHFFRTSLWKFIFLHVARFSCCTLFMLHLFYTAAFPCCTFLRSNVFMLHFFSSCTLFMNCSISCCTFTSYNVFVLHSSPVAIFACCNFFLLQFVHFALFPEVLPRSPQTSTMESVAVFPCCTFCSCWIHVALFFLSIALFSCCTCLKR